MSVSTATVPVVVPKVIVGDPPVAGTVMVVVPLVVPFMFIAPVVPPAVPIVTVEAKVGAVPKTARPVPVSSLKEPDRFAEEIDPLALPYSVPEVGNVTLVVPVNVLV